METTIELLKLEFNAYLDLAEKIIEQAKLNQEKLTLPEMPIWARKAESLVETAKIVRGTIEKLKMPGEEILIENSQNAWLN